MIHKCEDDFEKVQAPCGCWLLKCNKCGVYKSIARCDFHQSCRTQPRDSAKYYLDDGSAMTPERYINNRTVVRELKESVSKMGFTLNEIVSSEGLAPKNVLEIGAGAGRYIPYFMSRGCSHISVEPDSWAAEFIKNAYDTPVFQVPFESLSQWQDGRMFDIICGFHVFEHFCFAPSMMEKAYDMLVKGGYFIMLVPDNKDLCNPDHEYFFNLDAVHKWLNELGYKEVSVVQRTIVEHEDYIYAVGVK